MHKWSFSEIISPNLLPALNEKIQAAVDKSECGKVNGERPKLHIVPLDDKSRAALHFPTVKRGGLQQDSSAGKESACNAGDPSSTPGSGRSPGEGKGYSLQYSGLEKPMDSPWGRKESDTTERLSLTHKERCCQWSVKRGDDRGWVLLPETSVCSVRWCAVRAVRALCALCVLCVPWCAVRRGHCVRCVCAGALCVLWALCGCCVCCVRAGALCALCVSCVRDVCAVSAVGSVGTVCTLVRCGRCGRW